MLKYSVVIATYNRAKLLKQCLDAVAHQTIPYNSYEVIVTNDGSRDNTDDIIEEFRHNHPEINFTYIKQDNHGVSHARNQGVKRAKGDIVFFTDDDCIVPENWIETLADGYRRHPEVAGVGGWFDFPEKLYKQSLYVNYSMLWLQKRFKGVIAQKKEIKSNNFFLNPAGNTANTSYRKKILERFGSFDELIDFVGLVDWELKLRIMRSGESLLYVPLDVKHQKTVSTYEVMHKFFNYGRGSHYIVKNNPGLYVYYFPSIKKYISVFKILRKETEEERMRFKANIIFIRPMVFIDLFFSRLGWEYQRVDYYFKKLI